VHATLSATITWDLSLQPFSNVTCSDMLDTNNSEREPLTRLDFGLLGGFALPLFQI